MISVYNSKKDCCGCTACSNICPLNAIAMEPDEEGFLYPSINEELCVDCGLCKNVCTFQNGYDVQQGFDLPYVYAAKHIDEDVRRTSTSGGAFTAISDYILNNLGMVYGVAFDENMHAAHRRVSTREDRESLKGSKYVQSDLRDIFPEIKDLLAEGVTILFTGTPCQVAALNKYLDNVKTEKLVLCDFVCHGTPSPLLWKEHIRYSEKKKNDKIVAYYCRSKVNGWHEHNELTIYQDGTEDYESVYAQKHKVLFYSHNILRPACYNCKYTNFHRPSDITIADFWGIEKVQPDFDDNRGVSLFLINSLKGEKLFESIKKDLNYIRSNITDCLQPQLQYPVSMPLTREKFWKDYYSYGYDHVIKYYAGCNINGKVKQISKKYLKKIGVLDIVRKLLR